MTTQIEQKALLHRLALGDVENYNLVSIGLVLKETYYGQEISVGFVGFPFDHLYIRVSGINGIPDYVIGGFRIEGVQSYEVFQSATEAVLRKRKK